MSTFTITQTLSAASDGVQICEKDHNGVMQCASLPEVQNGMNNVYNCIWLRNIYYSYIIIITV